MYSLIREMLDRFHASYEKREEHECWNWTRGKSDGYGAFYPAPGRKMYAHRFALELKIGEPIPDGMFALHSCDNPSCVNPSHLRVGNDMDNVHDMISRGRMSPPPISVRRGVESTSARLDEDMVRGLLWDRISGMSLSALSYKYPVTPATISFLVNGKTWKHVFGAPGFPTLEQVRNAPKSPRGAVAKRLAKERRGS